MTISIPLTPAMFNHAENVVARSPAFTVTAWRTRLDIEMLRIATARGHVDVLPFMGQMIWDAVFDGVRLTMDSAFPAPRPAHSIVETYGCLAYHSGILTNGCPGPEDDHPLHGEMPCKRMDAAHLEFCQEDGAPVIRVGGHVDHVLGFGPNYRARPSVTLGEGTVIGMGMVVENRSALPMDLMYMAHVNFAFVPNGIIHQPAPFSTGRTRVRTDVPAHVTPNDDYRAFLSELSGMPEAGRVLDQPERWNPEQVIYVDAPGTDAAGMTHAMLERPQGDGFAMSYATAEFGHMVRWILHGADAKVAAFALPSTCEPEGYLAERTKGNVGVLHPGETRSFMARFGYVTRDEAAALARTIAAIGGTEKDLRNG
ncbi:DUF4432 family protein [Roseinatronobacter alkalisoli]|uniref:DUF4432 family protein n=1 Tax=Roseinatronobacter alkalisoli TaxID=3028235 RepID=A0ABT5TCF9_9RHOB|nr:DUF4432 family protein [Roseinatronobacter sp. HJB301]MDD7972805.1 DUF4432 family protein [Roseinatronobacter sp. HJB301]